MKTEWRFQFWPHLVPILIKMCDLFVTNLMLYNDICKVPITSILGFYSRDLQSLTFWSGAYALKNHYFALSYVIYLISLFWTNYILFRFYMGDENFVVCKPWIVMWVKILCKFFSNYKYKKCIQWNLFTALSQVLIQIYEVIMLHLHFIYYFLLK